MQQQNCAGSCRRRLEALEARLRTWQRRLGLGIVVACGLSTVALSTGPQEPGHLRARSLTIVDEDDRVAVSVLAGSDGLPFLTFVNPAEKRESLSIGFSTGPFTAINSTDGPNRCLLAPGSFSLRGKGPGAVSAIVTSARTEVSVSHSASKTEGCSVVLSAGDSGESSLKLTQRPGDLPPAIDPFPIVVDLPLRRVRQPVSAALHLAAGPASPVALHLAAGPASPVPAAERWRQLRDVHVVFGGRSL
jgi:hypothetical protein